MVEYREVSGCPGYRVGSDGSVWSCLRPDKNATWRRLTPGRGNAKGYLKVSLGRKNQHYVHTLVLEAFIGQRPDGCDVCHNDGNGCNNNVSNLRWDTRQANMHDAVRHGAVARGESHWNRRLTEELVKQIRSDVANGMNYRQTARKHSTSERTVRRVCKMEGWKHVA